MATLHVASWLLAALLVPGALAAQAGKEIKPGDGANPGYAGPGDLAAPPQPVPPAANPGPAPLPVVRPGNSILPPAAQALAAPPALPLYWFPPDTTEWIFWWRWQRWPRLAGPPPRAPGQPVTPGGEIIPPPAGAAPVVVPPAPLASRVMPELLRLWQLPDNEIEVQVALLLALGRCGNGPAVEDVFVQALRAGDERVVQASAIGLGALGEPFALPRLVGLVGDTSAAREFLGSSHEVPPRVAAAAAFGLGLLVEQLAHPELRSGAAEALVHGLQPGASAGDDLPVACAQALGLFPGEDAEALVPELLAVLRDGRRSERIRAAAALAAGKLLARAPAAGGSLARAAGGELRRRLGPPGDSALVRQACALALGRCGTLAAEADAAARSLLGAMAEDADPRVRHMAALGLADLAAGGQAPAQSLALPALRAGLREGTTSERAWCALALGWAGVLAVERQRPLPRALVVDLAASLDGADDAAYRAAALLALGLLDADLGLGAGPDAAEPIGDPVLAAEAVAGCLLRRAPAAAAAPWLDRLDPLTEGFQSLCAALARVDPGFLADQWRAALAQPDPPYTARFAAAHALGWLRNEEAVVQLLPLAAASQPVAVRAAAVASLGRAGERGTRPWNAGYLDLLLPYAGTPALLGDAGVTGVLTQW